MEATTQNFEKRFFINRSENFIALLNLYARHLGVKISGPYCTPMFKIRIRWTGDLLLFGPPACGSVVICKDQDPSIFQQNRSEKHFLCSILMS
jgi:hypothetical protein